MADTAEHLGRLRNVLESRRDLAKVAHKANRDDAHREWLAEAKSLRWAIDTLSRLTIDRALRLARDEGRLVRCPSTMDDIDIAYVYYQADAFRFMERWSNGHTQQYTPTLADILSPTTGQPTLWEVIDA